ncbi:MAG: hypothetical protein K8R63_05675, partial [Bacteroidales bacterium]|nr:hypothetical protein [Bacteroidales bacterium]
ARAEISLEGMGAFQGSQYIQEGFCENPEKADKISSKPDSMIIFKAVLLITQSVYQMQIIQDEINKKIYMSIPLRASLFVQIRNLDIKL